MNSDTTPNSSRATTTGRTADGQTWTLTQRAATAHEDGGGSHTFTEFAGPVFEIDGTGGILLTEPVRGQRLHLVGAPGGSVYDALRKALALAEELDLLS